MIKRNAQSVCRLLYACFLIVYMAVREVVPLQFLIANNVVSGVVFLLGFALIVWDICTRRRCLYGQAVDLLILFVCACVISTVCNLSYGVSGNVKAIGALVLEYGLLYACGVGTSAEQAKREMRIVSIVLVIVWSLLTLVSVQMYVFDVEYAVQDASQGFHGEYGRLWGVFQDPGYAGFMSMISIFAAVFLMTQYRKAAVYVLCGLQIVLQFSYIVLGGSRATLLILLASVGMLGIYRFVMHAKRGFFYVFRGWLLGGACVCVCLLSVVVMQYALPLYKTAVRAVIPDGTVVERLYDDLYGMTDAKKVQRMQTDKLSDVIHRTDTDKADVSNGRFTRWKHTAEIFLKSPVFGTSPRNVSAYAKEHAPHTLMAQYGIAPHSGYLDVLVGSGAVGFILFISFLGIAVWRLWRRLSMEPFTPERAFAAVTVFLLAASAVFISDIFFFFTAGAVWFWMMLGYALHTDMPRKSGSILLRLCNGKKGERT